MVYQKTAIQHGSSTLTSRVDPATLGSSFVMNLVEDGASSAHDFATFSGATNELLLKTSAGAKGTLVANVNASEFTTAVGTVSDGTNTLSLEPNSLQFNSDATIVSSGGTLTVENLLISGAEISNANLVLSGSSSVHLNTSELIVGDGSSTGGKILSSTENGVGVLTIDPSPDDNRGSLVIKGDLTVEGTTTTVNSTEITISDAVLELNGGNAAADSGLRVNRQGSTAVEFLWDQSEDYWTVGSKSIKAANFIGTASAVADLSGFSTNHLAEGDNEYYTDAKVDARVSTALSGLSTTDVDEGTNLYYTDSRARGAISVRDSGGDGSLTYNSSTGLIEYVGPSAAEVRAHFSAGTGVTVTDGEVAIGQSVGVTDNVRFATVTANLTGDVSGTVSDLSNHTTNALEEGTNNKYYTDARARGALSVTDSGGDGSLAYDSSTGVLTYTGPSATEVRAHFSAGTGVTVTDGEVAIGQSVGVTDSVRFATVTANLTGDVSGTVSDLSNHTTNALEEGTNNKYYTDARARGALSVTDSGGDGSLAYDSSTGVLTYTGPSATEVRTHFSAGTGLTLSSGEFSLGQSMIAEQVGAGSTKTKNLQAMLTSSSLSPFRNSVNGGAATLYVGFGDVTKGVSMGVYHAIVMMGVVNIVSQLESSANGLKMHLNGNDLVVENSLGNSVNLSIRVVVQFDNTDHL